MTNDIPVYEGGKHVGWQDRATGVYTPAVRVEPPGQPIGFPRPLSKHWSE
jgi:hypothetical protein